MLTVSTLLPRESSNGHPYFATRARAANRLQQSADSLRTVFTADTLWGLAAALWISTGLWRVFGSIEKTTSYYWNNHVFLAKMALLAVIIALEIWPIITLIKWRRAGGATHGWDLLCVGWRLKLPTADDNTCRSLASIGMTP